MNFFRTYVTTKTRVVFEMNVFGGCKPRNFSLIVDLFSLVDSTSLLLRCRTAIRLKIHDGDWEKKQSFGDSSIDASSYSTALGWGGFHIQNKGTCYTLLVGMHNL